MSAKVVSSTTLTGPDRTMQTKTRKPRSYVVQVMLTIFVTQVQVSARFYEQLNAWKVPCCRNKMKSAARRQSLSGLKSLLYIQ